jgi:hypothetical protein
MKLAKLSLAAIVAVGTMTSVASATPLEEAIKGVDVSGMIRYRWYNYNNTNNVDYHRYSVPVTLKVPVADNLTAGATVRAEQRSGEAYAESGLEGRRNAGIDTDDSMDLVKAWFMYSQPNYSIKAGKFEINTPWTDPAYGGDRGNGALALYTGVEGWTFAAAGFAQTNIGLLDGLDGGLYTAAAIGSMGPVNAQVWVASAENRFDYSVFGQLDAKFEGFSIKAQANQLELTEEAVALLETADDSGMFWGVEAGFGMEGFKASVGYTQNDEDQPVYELNADSAGMIKAGKQIYYETSNASDAETMFITAGYSFDKYRVGAGYVTAEEKTNDANGYDWDETYFEVGYKYSKNFDLSAYYSMLDADTAVNDDDEFRFQAIYKF